MTLQAIPTYLQGSRFCELRDRAIFMRILSSERLKENERSLLDGVLNIFALRLVFPDNSLTMLIRQHLVSFLKLKPSKAYEVYRKIMGPVSTSISEEKETRQDSVASTATTERSSTDDDQSRLSFSERGSFGSMGSELECDVLDRTEESPQTRLVLPSAIKSFRRELEGVLMRSETMRTKGALPKKKSEMRSTTSTEQESSHIVVLQEIGESFSPHLKDERQFRNLFFDAVWKRLQSPDLYERNYTPKEIVILDKIIHTMLLVRYMCMGLSRAVLICFRGVDPKLVDRVIEKTISKIKVGPTIYHGLPSVPASREEPRTRSRGLAIQLDNPPPKMERQSPSSREASSQVGKTFLQQLNGMLARRKPAPQKQAPKPKPKEKLFTHAIFENFELFQRAVEAAERILKVETELTYRLFLQQLLAMESLRIQGSFDSAHQRCFSESAVQKIFFEFDFSNSCKKMEVFICLMNLDS